jgi:hypothetical protein
VHGGRGACSGKVEKYVMFLISNSGLATATVAASHTPILKSQDLRPRRD